MARPLTWYMYDTVKGSDGWATDAIEYMVRERRRRSTSLSIRVPFSHTTGNRI